MGKKANRLPLQRIEKLYIRDGGRCWICGEWGPVPSFNKDHLIPKSLGGSDGMWNIRISHPTCNAERNLAPPPLDDVLLYCTDSTMIHRALRMYYRAYPHLKGVDREEITKVVEGVKVPRLTLASVSPGPAGHKRYPSHACGHCSAWCDTCKACWCTASDNDHDVLRIRRAG